MPCTRHDLSWWLNTWPSTMPELPKYHVLVRFGDGIPVSIQGPALMRLEQSLREWTKLPCEVFLETMRDQNKLRRLVTKDDLL